MSETFMTIRGYAANNPELHQGTGRAPMAVFRVGVNPRYYDRTKEEWVDGRTEWYSVMSFGNLAKNVAYSLNKGDPVVVYGRFRTSQWQPNENERPYLSLEIVAASVGHDLRFGSTRYARTRYDEQERGESATSKQESAGAVEQVGDPTSTEEPNLVSS